MYCSALPALDASAPWLLADVGGTFARVGCWSPERGLYDVRQLANAGFADIHALLRAYRGEHESRHTRALLAFALPVTGDSLRFTNRDWTVSAREVARVAQFSRLVVLNDFVAAAAGAIDLMGRAGVCQRVDDHGVAHGAVRVVLGSGTGLGVATIVGGETVAPRILESEAGHMSFAASPENRELLQAAQAQWGRVSWERLLCGDGLAWVDSQLRADGTPLTCAQVIDRAREGEEHALGTLRWYARTLGSFAGDMCLAVRATAGVMLAGGILARLGQLFDDAAFRAGFTNKGRFAPLLEQVPCWRFSESELALHGLISLLCGAVRAPGLFVAEGAS
jgi:glucokinase